MGEPEKVDVACVRLNSLGKGQVVLSNGAVLGRVRGVQLLAHAGSTAELLITVDAVTVHVGGPEGEGWVESPAPLPA